VTANRFDDYDRQRTLKNDSASMVESQKANAESQDMIGEEIPTNTVERFTDPQASFKIDMHNKVTYQILERDMKGRDVLF
jgi:hypothetical protein